MKIDSIFNSVVTHIGFNSYNREIKIESDIDSLVVKLCEKAYPLDILDIKGILNFGKRITGFLNELSWKYLQFRTLYYTKSTKIEVKMQ